MSPSNTFIPLFKQERVEVLDCQTHKQVLLFLPKLQLTCPIIPGPVQSQTRQSPVMIERMLCILKNCWHILLTKYSSIVMPLKVLIMEASRGVTRVVNHWHILIINCWRTLHGLRLTCQAKIGEARPHLLMHVCMILHKVLLERRKGLLIKLEKQQMMNIRDKFNGTGSEAANRGGRM